jgi:dolichol-phosphate mannosyltransferase
MVCLPTYNERENLEPMIRALGERLDTVIDRVLVIDDNSPDGTGELADGLAAELPWVEVLHRPGKEGLGPAYIAGFDFSHDPADVPRLIAACQAGTDLALGSRWVEGGGTVNWGVGRKLVSRAGSLYARTILGVGVRDLTGGFKCFRREVLEGIDLDEIAAKGYGFQIEVTYRALRKGFAVTEIPITFADRRIGESKMGGSIVVEAMLQVPMLRYHALRGYL